MKLYSYFRSSAAYRVRIALGLKGIAHEIVPIHLLRGGANGGPRVRDADYRALNPQARVPTLVLDDGTVLTQSQAILEWLEETHPSPPLLPAEPVARAKCRAIAAIPCADIQPLQNTLTGEQLKARFGATPEQIAEWTRFFVARGLAAMEALLPEPAPFAFGAAPTLADVCLVPQLVSARRNALDLGPYPKVLAIEAAMMALPAVRAARPEVQPDAE
jgi:maleylacetoacetate isomerase